MLIKYGISLAVTAMGGGESQDALAAGGGGGSESGTGADGLMRLRGRLMIGSNAKATSHVEVQGEYDEESGWIELVPSSANSSTTYSRTRWEGKVELNPEDGVGHQGTFELREFRMTEDGTPVNEASVMTRAPALDQMYSFMSAQVVRDGKDMADEMALYVAPAVPTGFACEPPFGQVKGRGAMVIQFEPALPMIRAHAEDPSWVWKTTGEENHDGGESGGGGDGGGGGGDGGGGSGGGGGGSGGGGGGGGGGDDAINKAVQKATDSY